MDKKKSQIGLYVLFFALGGAAMAAIIALRGSMDSKPVATLPKAEPKTERTVRKPQSIYSKTTKTEPVSTADVSDGKAEQEKIDSQVYIAGAKAAGKGFYYKNVSFKRSYVMGEIINRSGKDYKMVSLMLSVYGGGGQLLDGVHIIVSNISNGTTKSFTTFLPNATSGDVSRHKIQFENGY